MHVNGGVISGIYFVYNFFFQKKWVRPKMKVKTIYVKKVVLVAIFIFFFIFFVFYKKLRVSLDSQGFRQRVEMNQAEHQKKEKKEGKKK